MASSKTKIPIFDGDLYTMKRLWMSGTVFFDEDLQYAISKRQYEIIHFLMMTCCKEFQLEHLQVTCSGINTASKFYLKRAISLGDERLVKILMKDKKINKNYIKRDHEEFLGYAIDLAIFDDAVVDELCKGRFAISFSDEIN